MPAYSKQLEDEDGNILYPTTTAGSVVDEDGVDVQSRINVAAYIGTGTIGSPTPWIQTSDIVDGAVTPDKLSQTYVKTTGDTMTGKLTLSGSGNDMVYLTNGTSSTETMVKAERTDTGTSVRFGVGTGGINHGVYSDKLGRWILVGNATSAGVWGSAYFVSGDTWTLDGMCLTGVTGSSAGTTAYVRIMTPKSMGNISTISVTGPTGSSTYGYGIKGSVSSVMRVSSYGTVSKENNWEIVMTVTLQQSFDNYTPFLMYFGGGTPLTFTFT